VCRVNCDNVTFRVQRRASTRPCSMKLPNGGVAGKRRKERGRRDKRKRVSRDAGIRKRSRYSNIVLASRNREIGTGRITRAPLVFVRIKRHEKRGREGGGGKKKKKNRSPSRNRLAASSHKSQGRLNYFTAPGRAGNVIGKSFDLHRPDSH